MREGKLRDTLMDKLANRLLAQELARANAMPDTDEGFRSNEQTLEYQRCLAEAKKVTLELGEAKEQMVGVLKNQLDEQIQECNQCLTEAKKITDELNETKEQLERVLNEQLKPQLTDFIQGDMKEQIEKLVAESLAKIQELEATNGDLEELRQLLVENESLSTDNVHKECVKVYRNVQAIVVEESAKLTETMVPVITKAKSKASVAVFFSIIAAVAAVGGVTLQVLSLLHII